MEGKIMESNECIILENPDFKCQMCPWKGDDPVISEYQESYEYFGGLAVEFKIDYLCPQCGYDLIEL